MKHVDKGAAPQSLEDWKALSTATGVPPKYSQLRNPEKAALHTALLDEQGHVCCYCGQSIEQSTSHIEHFRPQAARPDLALDYDNLLASCIREMKPGTPLHCGHAKGNGFDEALHLSPLESAIEGRFQYTLDGQIQPTDPADAAAVHMRHLLKLDIALLNESRADAIERVFTLDVLTTVTRAELEVLIGGYRRRDDQGRFEHLGHVLARFAEQRLADIPSPSQLSPE